MERKVRTSVQGRMFYTRTFALVALGLLGYLCFRILLPYWGPLVWAGIIAFLLQPINRRLVAWLRGRENLAAFLLTLGTFLFLLGPLTLLGAAFVDQATDLLQVARSAAAGGKPTLDVVRDAPLFSATLQWLEHTFDVEPERVRSWILQGARNMLQLLASLGQDIFFGAISTLTGFTIMIFILFFMIRDGERILRTFEALVPMAPERTERLVAHMGHVTRAVVFGVGLTALIQGSLVGVSFAVLGLPAPVVIGAVASLFALLPVGGSAFVWGPASLVLAANGRWLEAAFLVGWGMLLVGTIDNLLRPILVSARGHVGTLTVFIGVLGGVTAFGTVGLLLGPVVLALGIALIRFTLELRQARAETISEMGAAAPDEERPQKRKA